MASSDRHLGMTPLSARPLLSVPCKLSVTIAAAKINRFMGVVAPSEGLKIGVICFLKSQRIIGVAFAQGIC